MSSRPSPRWIAFARSTRIAEGNPRDVAAATKAFTDDTSDVSPLVFDAHSSHTIELDLRGTVSDVLARIPAEVETQSSVEEAPEKTRPRGPGRPKLGVVAREVTLLPRHWEWLASQPGGASVGLRKLVEQARRANRDADRLRKTTEDTYRFMHAIAGDEPLFEEASRALFAGDVARLTEMVAAWPPDVRDHTLTLAEGARSGPIPQGSTKSE